MQKKIFLEVWLNLNTEYITLTAKFLRTFNSCSLLKKFRNMNTWLPEEIQELWDLKLFWGLL